MDKSVFISHSSNDHDLALDICDLLERNNIQCWIAPRDVVGGRSYPEEIVRAIRSVDIVLLIASSAINASEQVLDEIEVAVNNGKIILPFKIDNAEYNDNYTYYLHRKHWIEALPDPDDYFGELVTTVKYLLSKQDEPVDTINDAYLVSLREKNRKKLIKRTEEKRFSFGLSIKQDEFGDDNHFYDYIKRIDIVDNEKNKYSSYRWFTITNRSDKPTTYVVHKECGENKINFSDMRFRAGVVTDSGNETIRVDSITDIQPNFVQVVKMYFPNPLLPGESINIFYRLDWVGEVAAYCKDSLSTSMSLTRYHLGVGHLIFGILNTEKIYGFELREIDNQFHVIMADILPIAMTVQDDEQLKPLHSRKLQGVYYDIPDAKDMASYRIDYKIDESDDTFDDEEFF